jgi:hypothetical protein
MMLLGHAEEELYLRPKAHKGSAAHGPSVQTRNRERDLLVWDARVAQVSRFERDQGVKW